MKKHLLFASIYFSLFSNGFSQSEVPSLQEQINSIHNVQENIKESKILKEQLLQEREDQRIREAEAKANLRRIEARKEVQLREAKIQAEKLALQKKKDRENEKDSSYQERLRDIEIERLKLELEAKKTNVNRENDFIDQKLKKMSAETDVIQSDADVNRSVSTGTKTFLESSSVTIGNPIVKEKEQHIIQKENPSLRWDIISLILGISLLIALSFQGYYFYKNKKK